MTSNTRFSMMGAFEFVKESLVAISFIESLAFGLDLAMASKTPRSVAETRPKREPWMLQA